MPPKTNAERQKAYRQRLKNEKPDKYEEIRIKHLTKVKENIKKKKENVTEREKEELRAKWRQANAKRAEIKKKSNITIQDSTHNNTLEVRKKTKNNTKTPKERLRKLIEENSRLKGRNKNLRQAFNRMKRRADILKKLVYEQTKPKHDAISIEITKTRLDDTPLTKSNSFLEETLPNVSMAEKEKVKKKLLLLNTITDSLKTEFNKADVKERKILKKVATNEIANKHKLKTTISNVLGLKGRIRMTEASKEIRKKYKKDIQNFFKREDVSRPSAGKNECITRNKIKVQKRYLIEPIYKLYRKYKTEGGNASLKTFYRFRPFSVVKPRLQDRNTCACVKHCNLSFKAIALKKLGLVQTSDIDELMKEVTCNKCFKCMYSECSLCKDKKLAIDLINEDSPMQWLQWKMGTHTYTKIGKQKSEEKQTKKYTKQVIKGTASMLVKEFQDDLQKFKIHYFNVSHQYLAWKKCIEILDKDEAALICDFSENFSCKQSEEIQAVHFGSSRNQVILHTCVLYRKDMNPQSICSISPNNEHGPGAIWAHLDPIINQCKDLNIKKIHIFSDSPATQYRQKHNFFLFQKILKDYGFEYATWNFFEASHGKGPADGVGGALKRQLDNHISHGNDITNAKEAFDYLVVNSKVKMFYINEDDIQKITKIIPDNVIPIKGTMKLHQIAMDGNTKIKYKLLSCFKCKKNICCDCYNRKEHELLTYTLTEPIVASCNNKRQALKKRNPAAKRFKINCSSDTMKSDASTSISYHSDANLVDVEFENKNNDIQITNDEGFENFGMKVDLRSDIKEKTFFRVSGKETQDSSKKEKCKTENPNEKENVTTLSSSRFMSANRAFYGIEVECLKAEGLTTTEDKIYSPLTGKEKIEIKGKEKGKKTVKRQPIIKEKYPNDRCTNVLRLIEETENQQSNELTTDVNAMPILFLDDLVGDEIIFDDQYMCEPEFNFNVFNDKIGDIIIEDNNAMENNTELKNINKNKVMPIDDNQKIKGKKCGLTILKEEKLENIHTRKKVVCKGLKPLSLNNYIHVAKQSDKPKSEILIVKPNVSRKKINNFIDEEEIYKALMESDSS